MNTFVRLLARLFFLLVAAPALLLGILWAAAVIADFGKLDWTQRLVEGGIALAALTVFVACVYGFRRIGAQAAATKLIEDVALAQSVERLEARNRSWNWLPLLLVMLLIGSAFAFATYISWKKSDPFTVAVFLSLTMMVLAIAADQARQLLRPGPMLAIDRQGLHDARYGTLPWQDMVGFRLHTFVVHGRTMHILKLGVRQPHRFIARAGWMARLSRLGTLRGKPGHGVIDIPLAALSVTSAAIMTMMERMRREVAPHLLQHWHESFSPKEVENMQTLQQFTADVSTLGENPSQEEMEAFERRMAARMPAMEAASRFLADQGKQRLQNLRKQTWIAVGAMGFLILLYALKIFSAL